MNTPTTTGPGLPGVIHPLLQPQPIIARGNTICPNCKVTTKAFWTKSPHDETDPYAPTRLIIGGGPTETSSESVTLRFTCEACGYQHRSIVFSDARFFYASGKGETAPASCGAGCACRASDGTEASPLGSNALGAGQVRPRFDHFDKLSPCVVLIEIVQSCNWSCPTCLATSAHSTPKPEDLVSFDALKGRIDGIIERRNQDIEILQLSGGEPTLHPEFFEILAWAQEHPRIHVVMINTNGTKLLSRDFATKLNEMVNRKKVHFYLKFNGPNLNAQLQLAGFNAHQNELRALEFVRESGIATTLAMTVVGDNLSDLWQVAQLGLGVPSVRGVNYQPRFGGGRIPGVTRLVDAGHVINHLVHQAHPTLTYKSILPLPCGDPNCQHIGMLHREGNTLTCIGSAVSDKERLRLLGFLKDKINYGARDLTQCGCETTEFGQLVGKLEEAGQMFRLSIKPFMTFGGAVHNWSCNRTDQCCTSVVGKNGELHSFCRVYNGLDGEYQLW